ncbi:MAG TPA: GNAT family N-acetyltransferase [Gemmatimonadaceae bacterium]|nr:GNAT family N-acetyltransferase [Gemmatimonadaceae bacterium]
MTTEPEILLVTAANAAVLQHVALDVFDGPVDERWVGEFMADARHHLVVAVEDDVVVGMVSAVHYVHPDKAPQLWINELGVAPSHHRRGIGLALLSRMLAHGRSLGCTEAWVGTEVENVAARSLYERAGGEAEMFALYSFQFPPA